MFGYLPGLFERARESIHACLVDAVIALGRDEGIREGWQSEGVTRERTPCSRI